MAPVITDEPDAPAPVTSIVAPLASIEAAMAAAIARQAAADAAREAAKPEIIANPTPSPVVTMTGQNMQPSLNIQPTLLGVKG
jgi:hypothetical protein